MTEQEIFTTALNKEDPAERASFLDQACAGNATLRRQVDSLLAEHQMLGSFMNVQSSAATLEHRRTEKFCTQIGPYKLLEKIGEGGMGIVYAAEQTSLSRRVALKILPTASLWSENALERFRKEVRITATLEHPNIVPVYEMGNERNVHFYAMKLVDGCSVAEVITHRKQVTAKQASNANEVPVSAETVVATVTKSVVGEETWYRAVAKLGMVAASTLAFAHKRGVIHRDIKPSNLLLDRQGKLFIADFGLARFEADVDMTKTGDLMGTPRFMSPEQASGKNLKELDARSDIFSLGSTLYELLTLKPVIIATAPATAIRELQTLQPIPLRTHAPNFPLPLERIVLKCLQPDPGDRYSGADKLAQDLNRFLEGLPVKARPLGPVRHTSRWIQRHPQRALSVIAGLCLSLIVLATGFLKVPRQSGESWLRGPPSEVLVESSTTTNLHSELKSPEKSPDMMRSNKNNRNNENRRNDNSSSRSLKLESLESRLLLAGFQFADFSNSTGLQLVGSASINAAHELRLTPVSPTIPGVPIHDMRGGAWYIADKSPVAAGFNTTFQFRASNVDVSRPTWGFAFVIQNSNPFEIRDGGNGLGYAGQMPDGIRNSLAIEFDNTQDPNLNDPSSSHVSVHTNGTGPNSAHEDYSIGSASMSGFTLDDGRVHTARIDYTPGTLRVFLDDMTAPLLIVPLELGSTLDTDAGRAWLGFTAASSDLMEILNWDAQLVGDFVIADHPSVIEGAAAATTDVSFAVKRIGNLSDQIIVNWATVDGTANGSSDFTANSGQLIFAPGESQKTIVVMATGDSQQESHESFGVVLSSSDPAYSAIAGKATVLNDDAEVSISDSSAIEGSQQTANLGAFVNRGDNGRMTFSTGLAWGPDGHLYAASSLTHEILKFDGTTGAFLGNFVSAGMGIEYPAVEGLVWHGNILYVLCRDSAKVLKFNASGTSLGLFIAPGSGGLQFAKGMVRGPDGTWYISSANAVLRYSAEGTPLGSLSVPNGTLNTPRGLRFGPDGHLYVASENNDSVIRFLSSGGNFIFDRVFIAPGSGGLKKPGSLLFHNGSLLVSSRDSNEVLKFNGTTGAFEGAAVSAGQGGLLKPHGLLLDAQGNLLVGVREEILRFGPASQAAFSVNLSSPNALPINFEYATSTGSSDSSDFVATSGTITFAPGQTSRTILVQTLDDLTYEGNETIFVNLSNPVGGTIVDSQGVGTIIDNELPPTKFYVVNDGTPDRTYEYSATGTTVENYTINSGNTQPRGVASNLAGDTVWVADKNRIVYVYNNSGGQGGSWSAGSLANNATVEGIATNGTDVWIVDSRSDKVYFYFGAASRTSGSQNAASSFSLNSGNTSPKGIVTDGSHLWVVNDSTTDKVFKYTLNGSLVGSWTIDSGNKLPTGLTIDPSGVSQSIWIVDSGTDKVYEYAGARARTSGSQSAFGTFALAAGNSNPQGIADPPPPSAMVPTSNKNAAIRDLESMTAVGGLISMPSIGTPSSMVNSEKLYDSKSTVQSTDDIMSNLGRSSQMPGAPLSFSRTQPSAFIPIDPNERNEVDEEDDGIDDLIGLVANKLFR